MFRVELRLAGVVVTTSSTGACDSPTASTVGSYLPK